MVRRIEKWKGEVAEWSKAMRLGRILSRGMGSNPIFVNSLPQFFTLVSSSLECLMYSQHRINAPSMSLFRYPIYHKHWNLCDEAAM